MAIDPITAGLQAVPAAISGITSLFQGIKARKLEKRNVRPGYTIPGEQQDNLALAQQQAKQGLPGAQLMQGYQKIARNATSALGAAQDRRGGLAAIGAIQQASNDASLNLSVNDAQARMGNIRNLMQQNNVMAQYRDKAWQWNDQQKYLDNAAAVRALKGASNANLNSAAQSAAMLGMTLAGDGRGGAGIPTPKPNPFGGATNFDAALPYRDTRGLRF